MKTPSRNQQQLKLFEQPSEPEVQTWQPIRDDFNFCRLAIFVSGDKQADRFRDIVQTYQVTVNGKNFEAKWEVHHDRELGLLGTFDRDVWWGILEIVYEIQQKNRIVAPEVIVLGSPTAFLKRIGKPATGRYMRMLNDSICRLLRTVCFSEKAYNCPSDGGYMRLLKNVTLITEAGFKGEPDDKGGVHESTWVRLGDYVRKNLEGGYIALIDSKYVRAFKGDLPKLLYPHLSYRFWLAVQRGRDSYRAHWYELRDYLAVTGWDSLARARDRMKGAIYELKQRGYIDVSSDWDGDSFVFVLGDKFLDELRNRLNAKDQYASWVAGKRATKQLSLIVSGSESQPPPITPEDEREVVLTRQAIRVGLMNQSADQSLLAKYGWTIDDATSLAQKLRLNNSSVE